MPRRYTDEEKAAALAMYVADGLASTWRALNIPKPTLAAWVREAGYPQTVGGEKTRAATEAAAARSKELRERLKVTLLEKALDLLDRMDAPHVDFKGRDGMSVEYPIAPAAAVQNYATSVGILIDKYRLESGEATNLTGEAVVSFDDHESVALAELARAEMKRRAEAANVVE